jgi:hypothetical protein
MTRWFTEKEVRRMIAEAVAEAVAPLKARIAELEAEVARLKKNSSTSSKPPSSDIVKRRRKHYQYLCKPRHQYKT